MFAKLLSCLIKAEVRSCGSSGSGSPGTLVPGKAPATTAFTVPSELSAVTEPVKSRPVRPKLPTRHQHLNSLCDNVYDVLVIGGGATGAGCALDAASRGLKTALVEADDFASATSSKSTKLIHGGVRYLQAALKKLDMEQYRLVREALRERATLLRIAPHLTRPLPIVLPVYSRWRLPLYWAGLKMYDLVAGESKLSPSHMLSKEQTLDAFPLLRSEDLMGSLIYYDAQHDDARMCLALALTAVHEGASVCNYVRVQKLLGPNGTGLRVALARDQMTRRLLPIRARCVVNATGPYIDCLRRMDEPKSEAMTQPASGTHIVLPGYFCPPDCGMLDPSSSDDRVLFVLPWQGHTLVGTTDQQAKLSQHPRPRGEEVDLILSNMRRYLRDDVDLGRRHVLSAWTGLRPLVADPSQGSDHLIVVSEKNLITIAGGKWTTYRSMAEETIDAAIELAGLKPSYKCCTENLRIDGAQRWHAQLPLELVQHYDIPLDVARHLASAYGSNAFKLLDRFSGAHGRLYSDLPYIEAEVHYAVLHEYAMTAVDVLARRMRIAFLNVAAALKMLPRVVEIMGVHLRWTEKIQMAELQRTCNFLSQEMGMGSVTLAEKLQPDKEFAKREISN